MKDSEFPLEKSDGRLAEFGPRAGQRPTVYRYVESPSMESAASPGYDSLLDYWNILFRHRKTLLSFALVGLLGATVISLVQTRIYRVRTSLEIQGNSFPENRGSADSAGSYSTPESYMETQVKLLQSESLLEHVIDKLKLQDQPATGWRVLTFRRQPKKEELIRKIQRNLTVRTSGNSRLLEILYESPDPKGAADFANTLVSEFIELSQEERWKSAESTAEWLTNHLNIMKTQLEQSEAQLQDYARTSGLADSLPEILEDPTMREYRQRLTDLQRQYAELSATLTPEHYKVQRVQAQINELKYQMLNERRNVLRRIGNEYESARRREALLSKAHTEQEKVVADQSEKAIHYDTLKRDVDSNRRLYETMLQKVKETSLTSAMRDSNVLVVDRARPPLLPYRPNLPMNTAIGLFSGVLLGFGFVLLQERIDRRISAPGDAQVYLDLPELGVIPLDELAVPRQSSGAVHLHRSTQTRPTEAVLRSHLSDCPELATWKRKPSLVAECSRTTLTSILLPNQNEEAPRVIVLTSPCPGDGKTTVACNLSIAVAEIGRKVLLIDGDLRRPRLHKVFGVPNNWGLSDVLWSGTSLETVPILDLVRETEVSGLSLLPGGSRGNAIPSNLFYSPRMSRLLARLRKEFDMAMIDAPPMIHLADARVLGRLADGVILVVRSGETTTESALHARQRFAEDGTRVLGTVLNSWDPKSSPRYGYGSYNDYRAYAGQ